jgi:hypothetical protein
VIVNPISYLLGCLVILIFICYNAGKWLAYLHGHLAHRSISFSEIFFGICGLCLRFVIVMGVLIHIGEILAYPFGVAVVCLAADVILGYFCTRYAKH